MKKCISVLLYLVLVVVFLGFDIRKLIDLKQLFLVLAGTVILYIPAIEDGTSPKFDKELIGQNALWASLIQAFILFLSVLFNNNCRNGQYADTALASRPLLYGFCIWVILHNEDKGAGIKNFGKITEERQEQPEAVTRQITADKATDSFINKEEQPEEYYTSTRIIPDIEYCIQIFSDAGLTKRETEVALLVLKRMSNAEIAEELFISETTVKKHMSNIFSKLGINKREQIRNVFH